MAAVVVTGVFGVLLVWFALQALRRGTLALPGNGSLQRGQSTFLLAVMALFGVGVWALSMAAAEAHALFDTDPGPMRTVEGPHFVIQVPERWQASDVGLPDEDAMSFVHPHGDLTVLFPHWGGGREPART